MLHQRWPGRPVRHRTVRRLWVSSVHGLRVEVLLGLSSQGRGSRAVFVSSSGIVVGQRLVDRIRARDQLQLRGGLAGQLFGHAVASAMLRLACSPGRRAGRSGSTGRRVGVARSTRVGCPAGAPIHRSLSEGQLTPSLAGRDRRPEYHRIADPNAARTGQFRAVAYSSAPCRIVQCNIYRAAQHRTLRTDVVALLGRFLPRLGPPFRAASFLIGCEADD